MEISKLLEKLSEALGETRITEEKKFALSFDGEPQGEFTEKELVDRAKEVMKDADETDKIARCHDIEDVKNLMKGLSWEIKELNEEIMTTGDKVAQACREALAAMDIIEDYAELNEEETKLVAEVRYLFSNMVPELQ